MSADYKQPNFVISKMNQKEAKTIWYSQVSYDLKSFPLQILSSFYKTQLFFPQVILLSLSIYFIYLARETLKEGFHVLFPWDLQISALRTVKTQAQASVEISRQNHQMCLVPTSVCRVSLCSRAGCCPCVPCRNMFPIKLQRCEQHSLRAHYPVQTMHCDSEMADEI